jgi:hypothetical protein
MGCADDAMTGVYADDLVAERGELRSCHWCEAFAWASRSIVPLKSSWQVV